ncbi:MAG: rubrerythrin family protein [Endomicrobium sp.]|jgi:rubrerythrin|nr:rubrerythrin family protein [Endomicrobium sp.]
MAKLQGTKTAENLAAAFAGESQARNKYTFFAAKAKEEGYQQAAAAFEEFADNEKAHAKLWFNLLGGIGDTAANLKAGAAGEHYESTEMYVNFARTAKEEGFDDIAKLFEQVGYIEKEHEAKYLSLLNKLDKEPEDQNPTWKCINCGHTVKAKNAPTQCPVCGQVDIAWSGSKAYRQVKD